MKRKHILLILLSILLLSLLLAACNGTKDPQGDDPQDIPPEPQKLTIYDAAAGETYNIIYSASATESVKLLVKDLQTAVKDKTGTAPKFSTDTSKLTVESSHEILVGKTLREESTKVLAKISGIGYRIERAGEKIVVAATNDTQLEAALAKLKELFTMEGENLTVTLGLEKKEETDPVFPLFVDGKIPFKVVIPAKGYSDDLYNAAQDICTFFSQVTGETFKVTFDNAEEETADAYEICLGNTTRAATREVTETLDGFFEYAIGIRGNRIVVVSNLDTELVKGVKMLQTDLARAIDGTYAGTPCLSVDYGGNFASTNLGKDFVLPDEGTGTFKGMLDCGKESFILYYQQVKEQSAYDNYVAKLKAAGAKVAATYTMGENLYTLLRHETYTSYISYLPGQKALRIYLGSPDDINPSTEAVKNAGLVTPKLWSFKIDVFAGGADGGMSYAIQLTDGRYLVFDGGYSEADAKELLKVLTANKPASHAKPIVAGWFISHLHGDHYLGFQAMASNHADEIEVEAFYYNFPYVPTGDKQTITPTSANSVESSMRKWPTAKMYRKVHSGETLHFSGADVKVICTLEDVYPLRYGDGNDTSTVVQVQIAGQKILFLGDMMSSESAIVTKLGADVLKSDIVQFSHHGYEGATVDVYKLADPETILWPMCILGSSNHNNANMFKNYYETNTAGTYTLTANKWVRESESVKKIIVSGAGTECLNLPYRPTGKRVVDYNAIYEQQMAEYKANQ